MSTRTIGPFEASMALGRQASVDEMAAFREGHIPTWTSPNGVIHALDSRGCCLTCGRDHLDHHGRTVRRYDVPGQCQVSAQYGGYPYECVSADKHPDALVSICATHSVWWRAAEYDTSA
jgi:hypothetical protein